MNEGNHAAGSELPLDPIDELIRNAPEDAVETVNEAILPIFDNQGVPAVDARDLYRFLEVGKDFSTWIKARIETYQFVEGEDFSPVLGKSSGGRPTVEYTISLNMAKELSMVERTERGKEARKYFIECERRANEAPAFEIPKTLPEALRLAADLGEKNESLALEIKEMEPDAHFGRALKDAASTYTATQVAKENGLKSAQALNAFLREQGVLYYQSGAWKPFSKYSGKGLFSYSSVIITKGGETYTREHIRFTAKGRAFVNNLLNS